MQRQPFSRNGFMQYGRWTWWWYSQSTDSSYRYCIPMDQYHRPVLTVEEMFFDQCDTGNGISPFAMVRFFLLYNCSAGHCSFHEVWCIESHCIWHAETRGKEITLRRAAFQDEGICEGDGGKNPAWGMLTTNRYPPKNCVYLESKHGDLVKCTLEDWFGVRYAQTWQWV